MRFALTKWYIDVVADDGRTAIAYWTSLRAGRLHHAVSGVLRAHHGPATSRFTLRGVIPPAFTADRLDWRCAPLGLHIQLERHLPAISARLLERSDGALDWCAEAPRARVRLTIGREVVEGLGYAERLTMTLPPWTLPLTTLRWGRWLTPHHAATWIVWLGDHPLNLVWLDGVAVPDATVGNDGVDFGDDRRLALEDGVTITDATVGSQLAALPPLRRLLARVAGSHQTRWRSRGVLRESRNEPATGWAIHEEVQWR